MQATDPTKAPWPVREGANTITIQTLIHEQEKN